MQVNNIMLIDLIIKHPVANTAHDNNEQLLAT